MFAEVRRISVQLVRGAAGEQAARDGRGGPSEQRTLAEHHRRRRQAHCAARCQPASE